MAAVVIAIRKRNKAAKEAAKGEPRKKTSVNEVITSMKRIAVFHLPPMGWRKYQQPAQHLYNHIYMQCGVAGLIVANFLTNIVQAQIDPKGDKYDDIFAVFEIFFNVVFLFELALNMYGTWFRPFWKSSWNVFDFAVVSIGWMFQLQLPLPGPMKLLRMMRAFRVFRLFKRIESLRKIMSSLGKAVPGVMNAFLIQIIIISIFAIIAVDRFQYYGTSNWDDVGAKIEGKDMGGKITNEYDETFDYQTNRGMDYGYEYYGTFSKSIYTMFQVVTGESWSEAVTRPMFNSDGPMTSLGSCFFYVFFSLLNGVVLINVVVAVLLEKMVDEPASSPDEEGEAQEKSDPTEDTVAETKQAVDELKVQVEQIMQIQREMQARICNVGIIKDQVAALLLAESINVNSSPPDKFPAYESGATYEDGKMSWKPPALDDIDEPDAEPASGDAPEGDDDVTIRMLESPRHAAQDVD